MGSEKKEVVTPLGYKKFEKFYNTAMGTSPVDMSALQQAISNSIGSKIEDISKNIEAVKEQRLKGLQHALTTAIGNVQYNPYASSITDALEKIRQSNVEPLQKAEQSIISEYQKINPELSKNLMLAGAYQSIPVIREHTGSPSMHEAINPVARIASRDVRDAREYANLLETHSAESYKSVMSFFDETKQMLKNLGLTDDEISSAMQPYFDLMEKGKESSLNIGLQGLSIGTGGQGFSIDKDEEETISESYFSG